MYRTASGAQIVVVEGKNTAIVQDKSSFKCSGVGNRNNVDNCGIFLYQSMSGDANVGTSTFTYKDSTLEIDSSSNVYSSAPMFFITNTDSAINLEGCTFNYGSATFLKAAGTSEWGTSGSNGGDVTLTLTNQDIEGDLIVDSISSLTINMVNSSIKGKINTDKVSSTVAVNLDADSTITLTGNSYLSSLTNSDSTGSNINKGSYIFSDYNGNSYDATGTGTTSKNDTETTSETTIISHSISSTDNDDESDNFTMFTFARNDNSIPIFIYTLFMIIILF